jgi:hypothetical protein
MRKCSSTILKNDTFYRKNLKDKIQAKLAEKKLQKAQIKYSEPPRYDEVFFEGVKWLDNLAGDPVQDEGGNGPRIA